MPRSVPSIDLVNNTRFLHYDRALPEGSPIATGVIEGACRHLVEDRMGRYADKIVPNPLPPGRPKLRLVK